MGSGASGEVALVSSSCDRSVLRKADVFKPHSSNERSIFRHSAKKWTQMKVIVSRKYLKKQLFCAVPSLTLSELEHTTCSCPAGYPRFNELLYCRRFNPRGIEILKREGGGRRKRFVSSLAHAKSAIEIMQLLLSTFFLMYPHPALTRFFAIFSTRLQNHLFLLQRCLENLKITI